MFYRFARALKEDQKGFTLVELMVVVVIIGVLVAIAIPVYNATTERAQLGACQANQRMIEGAAQQYIANNPDATYSEIANNINDVLGKYFQDGVPVCPAGTDAYTYNAETQQVECPNDHPHY